MKIFVLGDPIIDIYRTASIDNDPDFVEPSTRISYSSKDLSSVALGGALNLFHAINFIDPSNEVAKSFVPPVMKRSNILSLPLTIESIELEEIDLISASIVISRSIFAALPDPSTITSITRFVTEEEVVRVDRETKYSPIGEMLLKRLELDDTNIFVLADYLLGSIDPDVVEHIRELDNKKFIILSTRDHSKYENLSAPIDMVVANSKDLKQANLFTWKTPPRVCIVTDQTNPVRVYYQNAGNVNMHELEVEAEKSARNPVGAGDVLVASIAYNIALGADFIAATQAAIKDARLSVAFDLPGYNVDSELFSDEFFIM